MEERVFVEAGENALECSTEEGNRLSAHEICCEVVTRLVDTAVCEPSLLSRFNFLI